MSARAGLRLIFLLQIALALALLAGDFARIAPSLAWPSLAPGFDEPVRPGDQTRRFQPERLTGPADGPDMPAHPDMPSRLFFEDGDAPGTIRVSGAIREGDGARFADWLAAERPAPERLQLNSPGGSVTDALQIGRAIRAAGLETQMAPGDICLSACPYMLMGGVARTVSARAHVGVHQHYFGENTLLPAFLAVQDIQRSQAEVLAHVVEMGIDPLLMRHSLATPPEEIYLLVEEELERYRLATELTP